MATRCSRHLYGEKCFLGIWLRPGRTSFNSAYEQMAVHLEIRGLPVPSRLHIKRIAAGILRGGAS